MGLMDIFYVPLGYIMKLCCAISFNNYTVALLFFAIIMQLILFPLGIKQQKSQILMAKMKPKEMAIRKKYRGRTDKPTQTKMNTEIQELYQKEGYNPLSGCLPLLIQLPIIFALFAVVRMPMTYTVRYNDAEINNLYNEAVVYLEDERQQLNVAYQADQSNETLKNKIKEIETIQTSFGASFDDSNIKKDDKGVIVVDAGKSNRDEMALTTLILYGEEKYNDFNKENNINHTVKTMDSPNAIKAREDLPNFNLLGGYSGLDKPVFGFNLLMLIPILVFISSFLGGVIQRKFSTPQLDANGNNTANSFMFKWGMPALSLFFCFSFSAAIGIYWIYRSMTAALQQVILAKLYPLPAVTEEAIAEAEREIKQRKKNQRVITIAVDEDDHSYDELIVSEEKAEKIRKKREQRENGSSDGDNTDSAEIKLIDKAPLQDETDEKKKNGKDGDNK